MRKTKKDYLFVFIQAILFLLFSLNYTLLSPKVTNISAYKVIGNLIVIAGVVVCLISFVQLNTNLSPFPSPKNNSNLIQKGIYKWIRHPIYTGILFITLGLAVINFSIYKLFISFLLFVLFYYKSKYEEFCLSQKFTTYKKYMTKTGRFLPKPMLKIHL
ncbi:methyltransferase family protein [Aquimarina agarilytica]|uniref:methyltransferase family protein n=1 Tax=Aquimarina agarilytica TaxID=1087449 RepID=UPI0002899C59|nr:isoprenylcysteine carboxylmethyltransferase family protein [Aquimarina agarilytica]